jgi:ribosome-binding protein aMBF1 (putative translation factor)
MSFQDNKNFVIHGKAVNKPKRSHISDEAIRLNKLDNDEVVKIKKLDPLVGRRIIEGRTKLGLSRKDLAMRVAIKEDIIRDYENGNIVNPSNQLLVTLENILNVKLTGKL